ncbi:hypothetical protein B0J11DRAFT_325104 [Dendryphion nanum]|uniref:Uncharacterized protein n=1 Tax=Dendryphion nanum TaxID=256645 RepID=A0A9P9DR77_9PLEO|nr:hypothetical protein B0J11DRAFT_325104 [Dendryphion nanum]
MCYYRLYVYIGCGHGVASSSPIRYCRDACRKQRLKSFFPIFETVTKTNDEQRENQAPSDNSDLSVNLDPNAASPTSKKCSVIPSPTSTLPVLPPSRPLLGACARQTIHPYQTYNIHNACPVCLRNREVRLEAVQTQNEIKVEDYRWQVQYMGDSHGASPLLGSNTSTKDGRGSRDIGLGIRRVMGNVAEVMGSWVKH